MRRIGCIVWSALLVAGCHRGHEFELGDTEGRHFTADCSDPAACVVTQTSGPVATDGRVQTLVRAPGRYVAVCDARPGEDAPAPRDCRALVCQRDDQCPPAPSVPVSACLEGLCTDPSRTTVVADSILLCLAGTGLGHSSPKQVEGYALGLNCGTPCNVPEPCRRKAQRSE